MKKDFPKTHHREMWNTRSEEKILNDQRKTGHILKRVTTCPSLPQRVQVYAAILVFFQGKHLKCPSFDNKLYSHLSNENLNVIRHLNSNSRYQRTAEQCRQNSKENDFQPQIPYTAKVLTKYESYIRHFHTCRASTIYSPHTPFTGSCASVKREHTARKKKNKMFRNRSNSGKKLRQDHG